MNAFNIPNPDNALDNPFDVLEQIARDHLDIETLEERGRDALDFHEVSVWSLTKALQHAYDAGKSAAEFANTTSVPIASLSIEDLETVRFDSRLITLAELRSLASDMADTYIEDRFWSDLTYFAEEMNLPRI